ncbi:hypothetical protein QNH36_22455 [Mesobacillus sp. AQ2]|uniref:hypothetical protein n=1 Tax=Mesobacillus sp. AQ2 TaxID=3043332 RepID=UPI0024C209EB|nr:hypothetical protein [Mesobacillus sp. AQ2]WHX40369.1 hypothetical protein QNH36_22455 [Mesobacillus sp. AQ2]
MERLESPRNKYYTLKNLYETSITVDCIAESLIVCDLNGDSLQIKKEMYYRNYDVIGVLDDNEIAGYIEREDLNEGQVKNYLKRFNTNEIITNTTPLIQFLHILKGKSRLFVLEKNKVTKLITSADLQKPPVRILIFGYITLLEMNLGEIIKWRFEGDEWKKYISYERFEKAEDLYIKRQNKNEDINLIECLQISDKMQIIRKDEYLFSFFKMSKSKWKDISDELRDLRDQIAHSNELGVESNWEDIIKLLENCEYLLEISEELLAEPSQSRS